MKVTILGCGTSGGVPRVGNLWGNCDPKNPKNRRRRVSILVEQGATRILVDTSPDLREQLLDANVDRLDAVLYTHDHADHTHGIDDLRAIYHIMGKPIPVWADQKTLDVLRQRFDYIFAPKLGYPAICETHVVEGPFTVGEIDVVPFVQEHGPITSLGYRFGKVAYSTDLNGIPKASKEILKGLEVWIVDALRYKPHPTHPHLEMTLGWIAELKPKRAILTHMTWDMDYATLKRELPPGVEPAFDGMVIVL
jgi:phosphoribosyl 1,2-cyclic phosphate phosphodiesterase